MSNRIAFVNGQPAGCGCRIDFSSGGGEYSDVHYLTPCALHGGGVLLVPVSRDEYGAWTHPQYPDLGEGTTSVEADAAFKALGLEWAICRMEYDDPDLLEQMLETSDPSFLAWSPSRPDGCGWFEFSIHDTEDGPVCIWVRKLQP